MEEGLLLEVKTADKYGGIGGSDDGDSSSSLTAAVVFSTAVAVCASFTYGCATGYTSPAESGIIDDLALSVAEYSFFGSILTIGGILGAAIGGKITDLIGRRGTMWFSEIFCTVGWLAIAFAKDHWWLDLGRLSIGFGSGLICYVVPVYIAEITPQNIRGGFTSAHMELFHAFLQVIGLFFIPRSPRWLVSPNTNLLRSFLLFARVGREEDLVAALRRLRGVNADISQEAAEIQVTIHLIILGPFNISQKLEFLTCCRGDMLIPYFGLMVLQQFGGSNAIAYYASAIFESADFSSTFGIRAMAILQVLNSYFNHPSDFVGCILIDKCGRRPLLMVRMGIK
ncbi:Sugar transporter ERD6-like 3 [Vitis vinifera]|uniref:Sugar transporter ERD6-like 3 n=1 Tax=Vitis vinifera TaxID=29760 RepID=A0A438F0C5_VITVI|nr:Sugar transporter ERD6-like 3 [Vitis vinifera]